MTRSVGLDENNRKYSFAASWEDFDNDGDQDLYVANDFGRKNLYRNNGGHFPMSRASSASETRVPACRSPGATQPRRIDGHLRRQHVFVGRQSDRLSAAIPTRRGSADVGRVSTHRAGQHALLNDGHGKFQDRSVEAAVTLGRWAWGSVFLDFNNDGWEDIFVSNGFVTGHVTQDL